MTVYEHALVGIDGALALGLQRPHGWQIVALAGFATLLPDFDGLTILFGIQCYADGHRLWGHNLLVAGFAVRRGGGCPIKKHSRKGAKAQREDSRFVRRLCDFA
jgi:hypothetical protein